MSPRRVDAAWDDEASVWVATSDDIPGLVTEADTLEELRSKLADLVPELLAENGHAPEPSTTLPIEVVATRHLFFDAACWSTTTGQTFAGCCEKRGASSSGGPRAIT